MAKYPSPDSILYRIENDFSEDGNPVKIYTYKPIIAQMYNRVQLQCLETGKITAVFENEVYKDHFDNLIDAVINFQDRCDQAIAMENETISHILTDRLTAEKLAFTKI